MYNSANIAERIKSIAKSEGIPIKKMLEDIGLGFNTMANMRTSMPKADNLAKIADYLGCSVDYLMGRNAKEYLPVNAIKIAVAYLKATAKEQKLVELTLSEYLNENIVPVRIAALSNDGSVDFSEANLDAPVSTAFKDGPDIP